MTKPESNRPLTGDDVKLLKAGDVLAVDDACSYLTRHGFPTGSQAIVRSVDGDYIDIAGIGERNGSRFSRFSFVSRPTQPEPERDGGEPWEAGADAICAAMVERSAGSIKRVSEDLYEAMMNDVQDWLRENVTYNLSGELSRRDHEIASLKDRLSTAERQRDEAVRNGRGLLRLIDETDEYQKRPDSGAWGVECACCMGELFDGSDRVVIEQARQALQSIGSGE